MPGEDINTTLWDSLSPDLIGIQIEGRIAYINTAGARLLGASSDQLIGRSILDFVHPDCREIAAEHMRQTVAQETEVLSSEEKWVRLDGVVINVRVAATPLIYKGKPAVQFIAREIA
jgi:PAS domain S-box-containing protein